MKETDEKKEVLKSLRMMENLAEDTEKIIKEHRKLREENYILKIRFKEMYVAIKMFREIVLNFELEDLEIDELKGEN